MFEIPDLLSIVQEWDFLVREKMPESGLWFAPMSPETGDFDSSILEVGRHRSSRAWKDLQDWLSRVGLPFHSPHKFRHGHAVYGLKQSKEVSELKAISTNLMHSNLSITDGVYGILSTADVGIRIRNLGNQFKIGQTSTDDLADQLMHLAFQIRQLVK